MELCGGATPDDSTAAMDSGLGSFRFGLLELPGGEEEGPVTL